MHAAPQAQPRLLGRLGKASVSYLPLLPTVEGDRRASLRIGIVVTQTQGSGPRKDVGPNIHCASYGQGTGANLL